MADLNTMYPGVANSPDTYLKEPLASGGSILYAIDGSVFGTLPTLATIGEDQNAETILILAKRTDSGYDIQRAVEGIARDWIKGSTIARNFTNYDYEKLVANINILDLSKAEKTTLNEKYDAETKLTVTEIQSTSATITALFKAIGTKLSEMAQKLVPTGGTVGQVLKKTADGVAWSEDKDTTYSAGTNVTIDVNNKINAEDTTYTAGENISINTDNQISATDTKYVAGTNVTISGNTISATDTKYTAGENITITGTEISATGGAEITYVDGTNCKITKIGNIIVATIDSTSAVIPLGYRPSSTVRFASGDRNSTNNAPKSSALKTDGTLENWQIGNFVVYTI